MGFIWRECCFMVVIWRVLCDGRCVKRELCDGRYVESVVKGKCVKSVV